MDTLYICVSRQKEKPSVQAIGGPRRSGLGTSREECRSRSWMLIDWPKIGAIRGAIAKGELEGAGAKSHIGHAA